MDSLKELLYLLGLSQGDIDDLGRMIIKGCCILVIVIVICNVKTKLDKEKYGEDKVWMINRICRAIRDSRRR